MDFNSLPHTEVDSISYLLFSFSRSFQLTTSHRGRPYTRKRIRAGKIISTHYLTQRQTAAGRHSHITPVFQLTTSHRGRLVTSRLTDTKEYFNSLPHTEVDEGMTKEEAKAMVISTHYLTQRQTNIRPVHHLLQSHFNSLPHTEVDSNLSQNSERISINYITNRTINLYFFHFKYLITITKH